MENSNLVFCQNLPFFKHIHHQVVAFLLGPKINQDLWFFHPVLKTHVREPTHCHEADTLNNSVVSQAFLQASNCPIVSSRHCCNTIGTNNSQCVFKIGIDNCVFYSFRNISAFFTCC